MKCNRCFVAVIALVMFVALPDVSYGQNRTDNTVAAKQQSSVDNKGKKVKKKKLPPTPIYDFESGYRVEGGIKAATDSLAGVYSPKADSIELILKRLTRQRDSLLKTIKPITVNAANTKPAKHDSTTAPQSDSTKISLPDSLAVTQPDSLATAVTEQPRLSAADSTAVANRIAELDSERTALRSSIDSLRYAALLLMRAEKPDSIAAKGVEELIERADSIAGDSLTRHQLRRLERLAMRSDTMYYRHSPLFRDSIPISRLTLISAVVPGFAQFYEGKYWKIPIGYAALGSTIYFGMKQNNLYKPLKVSYDDLVSHDASREQIDPVQTDMIKHNTRRQILYVGAAVSYMALLADGVVNYPAQTTRIKKATTLSMVIPGGGQFYNKSYWKIPWILGGAASMYYVVDWNSRGYKRFEQAYKLRTDGDDTTLDEFNGTSITDDAIKSYRDLYRRNRDLALIGLVGCYIINIADAHIDAHLQDYDVSGDLTYNITPSINYISTQTFGRENIYGLNIAFYF